jgi:hypothetical protein
MHSTLIKDANGFPVQAIKPDWSNIQNVTTSGTSAATADALPADSSIAMIIATEDVWFIKGASPTAAKDDTSIFLPANTYIFIPVIGGTDKIAFIQDSTGGTAQVIPAGT